MASIVVSDDNPNQQQQSLIPVLTVFKNNSILKNIIILNNNNNNNNNNDDQILLVGRHPNCNIVLFHPSISRFHIQIRITPSSRSISLLDLSSGISLFLKNPFFSFFFFPFLNILSFSFLFFFGILMGFYCVWCSAWNMGVR